MRNWRATNSARLHFRPHPDHATDNRHAGIAYPKPTSALRQLTIRRIVEDDERYLIHTDIRDHVKAALSGKNVSYHFERLFPRNPGTAL